MAHPEKLILSLPAHGAAQKEKVPKWVPSGFGRAPPPPHFVQNSDLNPWSHLTSGCNHGS